MRNKDRQRRLEKERAKRKPVSGPPKRFKYSEADRGADKEFFLSNPDAILSVVTAALISKRKRED